MDAFLIVRSGLTDRKRYHLVSGKSYLVGRSREADIIVKDRLASRNHCRIASSGEEWTVADLGSSNGTYVNRQRVTTHALRDGDVLQVGGAAIEFRLAAEAAAAPPDQPQPAEHTPAPAPEPAPAPSPPPERPGAEDMANEDDLRELFEFLDRIEKGETPSAASRPAQQPAPPAASAPDDNEKQTGPAPDDEGGLLGFLRRKKKQP